MAKICFTKYDGEKINREGWNTDYGKLVLNLTTSWKSAKGSKGIQSLDEALDKKMYQCIGEIPAQTPGEAFSKVQNIDESHPLKNRSMMVGDVVLIGNEGFFCESTGWSNLTPRQLEIFKKMPITK